MLTAAQRCNCPMPWKVQSKNPDNATLLSPKPATSQYSVRVTPGTKYKTASATSVPETASNNRAAVTALSSPHSNRLVWATSRAPNTGRPNCAMINRNALIELANENDPNSAVPKALAT